MRTWFTIIGWIAAVLGAVALVLYLGFFDVWRIPVDDPMMSASILPTLGAGDLVVVSRHGGVARGYLLRCPDPQAPGRFVVARAIGRTGDHVELSSESVTIDGQRSPSPRACDPPVVHVLDPQNSDDVELRCSVEDYGDLNYGVLRSADHPEPPTRATVDPDRWFLVSDDRHVHVDSRDFGQVDPTTCQHVVFRIMSAAGLGDSQRRLSIIW